MQRASQAHHLGVAVGHFGLDYEEVEIAPGARFSACVRAEKDHAHWRSRSLCQRTRCTLDVVIHEDHASGRSRQASRQTTVSPKWVRLGLFSSPQMGLLGSYSNPEVQERIGRLSEKLERLVASNAVPRPSGRQDRKLRGGLVPKAIEHVLREAPGPMRARDVHAEVEEMLSRSVPASSVKNWLAKQARSEQPRVVRLDRGRYRLVVS